MYDFYKIKEITRDIKEHLNIIDDIIKYDLNLFCIQYHVEHILEKVYLLSRDTQRKYIDSLEFSLCKIPNYKELTFKINDVSINIGEMQENEYYLIDTVQSIKWKLLIDFFQNLYKHRFLCKIEKIDAD